MRYIDADECLDIMRDEMAGTGYQNRAMNVIKYAPTADVVKVVRCKDCKHYHKERHICELFTVECDEKSLNYIFNVENDDYCVKGERRC